MARRRSTKRKTTKSKSSRHTLLWVIGAIVVFAALSPSDGNKKDTAAISTAMPAFTSSIASTASTQSIATPSPTLTLKSTDMPTQSPTVASTPQPTVTSTPSPTAAPTPTATAVPTPIPTATPTSTPTEIPHLKKGDTGDAVTTMQERLIWLDYLDGEATGSFDSKTVQAVKDFQLVNGLDETGEADPNTLSRMFRLSKYQRTVYVSKTNTYHGKSDCSGMKHYKEMKLSDAIRKNYKCHDRCN